MMKQVVYELEDALHKMDQLINLCYTGGLDYHFLTTAKEAMTSQLVLAKESIAYKMEEYEDYGTPLNVEDVDGLKVLIEEVGYNHIKALFGESVDMVLAEAVEEE